MVKKAKKNLKKAVLISDTGFSHQDTEKIEMKKASRRYFSAAED